MDKPVKEPDDVADELPSRSIRTPSPAPKPAAKRRFAEALASLGADTDSSSSIVRAVEAPEVATAMLKSVAEFGVHGGAIRYITARVRLGAVLPIPTNPRVAARVRYAAGASEGGIEPLEARASETSNATLVLTSNSIASLKRDLVQVADQIRASNDLTDSVRSQGVLLPITVIPVEFRFRSGERSRTLLCSIDGSSRLTAAMTIWEMSYESVLFGEPIGGVADRTQASVAEMMARDSRDLTDSDRAKLRNQSIPANVVVGWNDDNESLNLPQVLDAYLGLIHVEPPRPWSEAAGQDKRADAVLDELARLGRLSDDRRRYIAGLMDPAEAEAAGFDASLDGHAAEAFFEIDRRRNANAVNRALRRIGKQDPNRPTRLEVATELALRPYRRDVTEQQRRNPRLALPSAMVRLRADVDWLPTTSTADELLAAALAEVEGGAPGSTAKELAVRGAFWLTRFSALQKSSRLDTRFADELLEHIYVTTHGIRVLHRAIVDGRAGVIPRQVRDDGTLVTTADGAHKLIDDRWLRQTFAVPAPIGDSKREDELQTQWTPEDELRQRIYGARDDAISFEAKVDALAEVKVEGRSLVEDQGIPKDIADEMTESLRRAEDRVRELGVVWRMTSAPEAN